MEQIPKTIHYIWFGKNEKSKLIKKCIESWKKYLPGYEIIEWNEDNYDINKSKYIKEAYENKKYAFAADFARFDIIYNYGGIYFDTDVELLKPIPEEFLKYQGFMGMEGNKKAAPGLILASKTREMLMREILDKYENMEYKNNGENETVVDITTNILKEHGFVENGEKQQIANFVIFPSEYFCAYDFDTREFEITSNTISIHHYAFTWGSKKDKIIRKMKTIVRKIIGRKMYKNILNVKRKIFGIRN